MDKNQRTEDWTIILFDIMGETSYNGNKGEIKNDELEFLS